MLLSGDGVHTRARGVRRGEGGGGPRPRRVVAGVGGGAGLVGPRVAVGGGGAGRGAPPPPIPDRGGVAMLATLAPVTAPRPLARVRPLSVAVCALAGATAL